LVNRALQASPLASTAKGKPYCSEARELAVAPPVANAPVGTTPDAIAATLTNQTLAAFLDRAAQAEAVIEACRAEALTEVE